MDKYRRDDDINDDLNVYRQDDYDDLTIIEQEGSPRQRASVLGSQVRSNELKTAYGKLSIQELRLVKLVIEKGYSIRAAAKRMNIRQQTASIYWKRVKAKLEDK